MQVIYELQVDETLMQLLGPLCRQTSFCVGMPRDDGIEKLASRIRIRAGRQLVPEMTYLSSPRCSLPNCTVYLHGET